MTYLATNVFTADGTKTFWDFSFAGVAPDTGGVLPYLYAADVKALELYKDAEGNAASAERTVFIDPSLPLRANIVGLPVAAGRQIKIYRSTEIRYPLVDYRDRQTVSEFDLDLANRQSIFVAQETQDAASNNMALDKNENYDVKDRRIVNLAKGVDGGDAVNLAQARDLLSRALRVPASENSIAELAPAALRAGRLLTFDALGAPQLLAPSNDSATALALVLASQEGGTRIGLSTGNTLQEYLDVRKALLESSAGAANIGTPDGSVQSLLNGLKLPLDGNVLHYHTANGLEMTGNEAWGRQYFVEDFGAIGDGFQDDTAAWQAGVLAIATAGSGVLLGRPGRNYRISGTVLVPSNVTLDFNGSTLHGTLTANTAMFRTAYMSAGILLSNIGSADETRLVEFTKFRNAIIKDAWRIFDFKNFIIGCSISDVRAEGCIQVIRGSRCFYSSYIDISARGGNEAGMPTFWFSGQNNAMRFTRVSATTNYGFAFTGGTTAVVFESCTYEGGTLGWYFDNEVHGVVWMGLYAEAVQGVLFNYQDTTSFSGRCIGGYLNYIDVVNTGGGAGYVFGELLDATTDVVNVGGVAGGFTYRGLINLLGNLNCSTVHILDDFEGATAWPTNLIMGSSGTAQAHRRSFRRDGVGVLTCDAQTTGVLPRNYTGNTGRVSPNTVAYCTHQAFNASTILVDTRIVYDTKTPFTRFLLDVQDATGIHTLYGDTYGSNVKRHDTQSQVITLENANGYIRFVIAGLTTTAGFYQCTGTIQLV